MAKRRKAARKKTARKARKTRKAPAKKKDGTTFESPGHPAGSRERNDERSGFRMVSDNVEQALVAGQERGTFSSQRSAAAAASFIVCTLQGLTLVSKTRPDAETVDAVRSELLRALSS